MADACPSPPRKVCKSNHMGPVPRVGQVVVEAALYDYVVSVANDCDLFPVGGYMVMKRSSAEDVLALINCKPIIFRLFKAASVSRFLRSQFIRALEDLQHKFPDRQLNNSKYPNEHWPMIMAGSLFTMVAQLRNLGYRTTKYEKCIKRLSEQEHLQEEVNLMLDEMDAMTLQAKLDEPTPSKPASKTLVKKKSAVSSLSDSPSPPQLRRSLSRLLTDTSSMSKPISPETSSEEEASSFVCSPTSPVSEDDVDAVLASDLFGVAPTPTPPPLAASTSAVATSSAVAPTPVTASSLASLSNFEISLRRRLIESSKTFTGKARKEMKHDIQERRKAEENPTPKNLQGLCLRWGRIRAEFYNDKSYVRYWCDMGKKWGLIHSDASKEKRHWEIIRDTYAYVLTYPCSKAEAKIEGARLKAAIVGAEATRVSSSLVVPAGEASPASDADTDDSSDSDIGSLSDLVSDSDASLDL